MMIVHLTKKGEVRLASLAAIDQGNLSRILIASRTLLQFSEMDDERAKAPQARKTIKAAVSTIRRTKQRFWIGQEPRMRLLLEPLQ